KLYSAWRSALYVYPQHVQRLGRGHEQMVTLGSAEAEIGAAFRQADTADQAPLRIPHRHAAIAQRRRRAGPDIAGLVGAHAVGAGAQPITHAFGEDAEIAEFAAIDIGERDAAGADDVNLGVIGGEANAIGRLALLERHRDLDASAGI